MKFNVLVSKKKRDFYAVVGKCGFKKNPIEGRLPYKNTFRVLDDEKKRAEFARRTGASISRRAIKEFDIPTANEWKRAKLRSSSTRP